MRQRLVRCPRPASTAVHPGSLGPATNQVIVAVDGRSNYNEKLLGIFVGNANRRKPSIAALAYKQTSMEKALPNINIPVAVHGPISHLLLEPPMLQPRSLNNTPEHRGKSTEDSNTPLKRHNNNIHHNTTNSMAPSKPPDNDSAPEPRTQASEFTRSLASITVPPGPDYYAARRELWLKPSGNTASATKTAKSDDERPPILKKLDELLELGADSDKAWKEGVGRVWKGLIAGGHLRWRLPMNQVVKVVHAGWMRDGETWPRGAVAPEPDDVLKVDEAETSDLPKTI